jgi:tRNA 2-thiouridine synthesizing protein A
LLDGALPDDPVAAVLDATGLTCPLPVLRARKALSLLKANDVLELHTTDLAAPKDIKAFCEATGHVLVSQERREGRDIARIRRK